MRIKILFLIAIIFTAGEVYSQNYQWRLLPNSPVAIPGDGRFEDIYFINPNSGWVVGYSGYLYRTTDGGNFWDSISFSTLGLSRSVGFFDVNTGLIGTLLPDTNLILYRSTNSGLNWNPVTNISGKRPQGICGISIINENTAYACGRYYGSARIIKTTDKGASWNLVFNDSSMARSLVDCYFWTADSGIAVGGYNTLDIVNGYAVIIKTTNGGASWQRVCQTSRIGEWCWKISFISREIGFVSIEKLSGLSYILKTTNNGNNWSEIPFRDYDQEGIGFVNENTGWVGGWGGPTYQTTNGGANWQLAGWGTYLNRFRFLSDTLAYAVGDRVYKYSQDQVGVQNISSEIPERFSLEQNYPNPFNPSTNIHFDIPSNVRGQTSNVRLIIYDGLGKEIAVLVNERLAPGTYNYQFSTINYQLASGIYFYRIEAGDFVETKRMILLK